MTSFDRQLQKVKNASRVLAQTSLAVRNRALDALARTLRRSTKEILRANIQDLRAFKGESHWRDRLLLTKERIESIIHDLETVKRLPDPLGVITDRQRLPNGLLLYKKTVPLGVIGIIYEARPNVTVDVASLCLKSGNAIVLKGGREAMHSNTLLVRLMHNALARVGIPRDVLFLLNPTQRALTKKLLVANRFVDLLIPRGGRGLIQFVRDHARVPVIETGAGLCHTYVDRDADVRMAVRVVENAKIQRPTVCNAVNTLLVHRAISGRFLPLLAERLQKHGVIFLADQRSFSILKRVYPSSLLRRVRASDFSRELLSLALNVKIVDTFDDACAHIATYGSGHSEAIMTQNKKTAVRFLNTVDAACLYVNASTRFTDGGQFGLGAEMGVSTQKLHARGPMALQELTSYTWCIEGNGQIRS